MPPLAKSGATTKPLPDFTLLGSSGSGDMAAPKPSKAYPDLYAGKTGSDADGKDLVSRLMIGFLGLYSKLVMHILNKTELRRAEVF